MWHLYILYLQFKLIAIHPHNLHSVGMGLASIRSGSHVVVKRMGASPIPTEELRCFVVDPMVVRKIQWKA